MHKRWKTVLLMVSVGVSLVLGGSLGLHQAHAAATPVTIQNMAFSPATVTVAVGTTVTWTNQDAVAHTATSDTSAFTTGTIDPGKSASVTFSQAGTFPYHCLIHPNMLGTVVVQQQATTPATTVATSTTPGTAGPTAVPPTTAPTTAPTAAATATSPPPAVGIFSDLLSSPSGVSGRFAVSYTSTVAGQGQVRFGSGPGCLGLIETGTQDQQAGTTKHMVVVTGDDMPGAATDTGLMPGATYWFELVTMSPGGEETNNNGGKCFSVTIPTTPTPTLKATLTGSGESPANGAANGIGTAVVTLDTARSQVCWTVNVAGISLPALASHIHKGAAGVEGPVVIPFNAPGAYGTTSGCATADPALIADILANPSGYYVNVHTKEFPGGAVRGQLGAA